MPRYLVNLGKAVEVTADDEQDAIRQAKDAGDESATYFHTQVQQVLDPADFTEEARNAREFPHEHHG